MVEKSDEFDECMLNRQSFPYQILHLGNLSIAYFTVIYYIKLKSRLSVRLSAFLARW